MIESTEKLMNGQTNERLTVTVTEAAEMLGVSRNMAYECVRTGEIPSISLGRRLLVPRKALLAMIDGEVAA